MPVKRVILTDDLLTRICDFVRAGGYPRVAAEAAGVPGELYDQWEAKGTKGGKGVAKYRKMVTLIRQAQAQARLKAEIDCRSNDPKFWLRSGPGKETTTAPGWSQAPKPAVVVDQRQVNLLASPEWNSLWALILQTLSAFPDARAALATALASQPLVIDHKTDVTSG
jgi:hypothetical protein